MPQHKQMDNDAAACDTGKEMTAECALPGPCASPVHVEPPLGCARDAAATSCALASAARGTRAKGPMGHYHALG